MAPGGMPVDPIGGGQSRCVRCGAEHARLPREAMLQLLSRWVAPLRLGKGKGTTPATVM
jgi:hypothetical protein